MTPPVRRFFAADHRRLNDLLAHALLGDGPLDLRAYGAFRAGLLRHIAMEEKVLFPGVASALGGRPLPIAARLRVDHGAIAALLVPTPNRSIAATLASVLGPHNEREEGEGGAYDACDAALGRERAEQVVSRLVLFPEPPLKPYNDSPAVMRHIEHSLDLSRRQWAPPAPHDR